MASEIGGLDPLHGFLKHGNYVVRLRVPYLQLEAHHEKFIERRPKEDGTLGQVKYVPPSIEPPRDAPGAQMEIKPLSQNQGQQHFYE